MSDLVTDNLPLIAAAPDGIKRLRGLILELAVRGKLVPQDPNDEPASELLKRIEAEKARLVKEGKIRKAKAAEAVREDEQPFETPRGWVFVHFDELATDISTGPFGSMLHKSDYVSGGIPLVNPSHMIGGKIIADSNIAVAAEKAEELGAYRLEAGDIVMARRGDVGRTAVVATSQSGWLCGTGSFVVRLLHELSRDFLLVLFRTNSVRNYLGAAAVGTTMVNLNHGILKRIPVPLPPLPEQHRIVARVDELMALCDRLEAEQSDAAEAHARLVDALLATLTASHNAAECAAHWQRLSDHFDTLFTTEASIAALKQTVLQLAVMGRLVPQDPTDEPASELLKRIEAEKLRLVKEGKIRKAKEVDAVGEDERPFELPPGWVCTRVAEVSSRVQYGYTASADFSISSPKLLRITDIQDGKVNWSSVPGVDCGSSDISAYFLNPGDLLIARTGGTIGKSFLANDVPVDSVFASYLIRISPSENLAPHYFKTFAESRSYWEQLHAKSMGTGQPNVNGTSLSELVLPLPPLPEQHRIVAKVDELMALCDRLMADLQNARASERRIAEVFTTIG